MMLFNLFFVLALSVSPAAAATEKVDCEGEKAYRGMHPFNEAELKKLGLDGKVKSQMTLALQDSGKAFLRELKSGTKEERWIVVRQNSVTQCRFLIFSVGKNDLRLLLDLHSMGFELLPGNGPRYPDIRSTTLLSSVRVTRLLYRYRSGAYREHTCELLELGPDGKEQPAKACGS